MNRSSSLTTVSPKSKSLKQLTTKAMTNMFSTTKLGSAAILFATAIASLGLGGCGPQYDRTEISAVVPSTLSSNDPAQVITPQTMTIPEGMIIKAHIVVWNDNNVQMPLDIRCSDNDKIEVDAVVSDRDYAFVGKKVGTTTIQFFADNKAVVTIQAQVVPQPEPSEYVPSGSASSSSSSSSSSGASFGTSGQQ